MCSLYHDRVRVVCAPQLIVWMESYLEVPSEILKIESVKISPGDGNGTLLLVLKDQFLLLNVRTTFPPSPPQILCLSPLMKLISS